MRMKKLLSILLVTAMLASMAVTAFANEGETKPETPAETPSVEDEVTPEETGKTEETAEMETLTPAEPVVPVVIEEPAEGTEATEGTIKFRQAGPGGTNPNYNYPGTYEKAGITCSNNTITINKDTFKAFYDDNGNAADVKVMRAAEQEDQPLYVGVLLSKPAGEFKEVEIKLGDKVIATHKLSNSDVPSGIGSDMYYGNIIQYIKVAGVDGTVVEPYSRTYTAEWRVEEARRFRLLPKAIQHLPQMLQ